MGIRGKLLVIFLSLMVAPLALVSWLLRSTITEEQWQILGGLIPFIVVLGSIISIYIARRFTRPLDQFSEATKKLSDGDFSARVDIDRSDELGGFARAFNNVVPWLKDHLQIKKNLGLAEEVQKNLLPKEAPDILGYDVAGFSLYCDETGGDYYDFLYSDDPEDTRLGVVVGDVSGHGVASALLMATVRGAVWSLAKYETDLGEGVREINNQLVATTNMGRFMTLFCLLIDFRQHAFQWLNAGHDPALIYRSDDDEFEHLTGEDIPLGIEGDWTYQAHMQTHISPGSIFVIGTDGIWETRNEKGEEFGKQAYQDIIRQNADKSSEGICQAVRQELGKFRGTAPQRDDITLVVIKNQA